MPNTQGAVPLSPSVAAMRGSQEKMVEQMFSGPEPVFASGELLQRYRALRKVQRSNADIILALQRDHQAGLDPVSLLQARLEALVTAWTGDPATADGQDRALRIEEVFEGRMAGTLEGIQRQVTQAKLAAGTGLGPQDMAALAGQAGLLKPQRGR